MTLVFEALHHTLEHNWLLLPFLYITYLLMELFESYAGERTQTLIRRAHRRNMAVQYWTINDADEMRMLIEMGVDCIMTDDPVLMRQVLDEYR